ncbi:MAG: hypothetical protein K9J12_00875 [Melioribacteraceae bacterium]|nr:hypothetical protein [Melioribacteraceae bacterium]MCF8266411.1 hypothetical protein [Melioribacteraceae bacterium]MCF8413389.1 hypothetical protein [Melioribacteraceae bacterium]
MKRILNTLFVSILTILLITACGEKQEEMNHENHDEMNSEMNESHDHSHEATELKSDMSIVREGVIDVEALDSNEDGKLFECPMDWNVIDDKAGNCPVCGMKLKEYSAADLKDNLDKFGYEYKK